MRFPLLVNASPSTIQLGPRVLLRPGKWKVASDHKDSVLFIYVDGKAHNLDHIIENTDPVSVWIEVRTLGREKDLNVFLENV